MTLDDIRLHLEDTTSLNDEEIELLAAKIYDQLDYSLLWQQVNKLAVSLTMPQVVDFHNYYPSMTND